MFDARHILVEWPCSRARSTDRDLDCRCSGEHSPGLQDERLICLRRAKATHPSLGVAEVCANGFGKFARSEANYFISSSNDLEIEFGREFDS